MSGGRNLDCATACALLKALEGDLRERGVTHLALVGSVARGEATADSDIDVVIHTQPKFSISMTTRVGLFLEEQTGRKVDVIHSDTVYPKYPLDALPEPVRQSLLRDIVRVF